LARPGVEAFAIKAMPHVGATVEVAVGAEPTGADLREMDLPDTDFRNPDFPSNRPA
jgi:hypothetical protein